MAKVKSAKQRITEFLKAKGQDADEIKETFAELDAADADLESLAAQVADATAKNAQWVEWYKGAIPEIQGVMNERDQLRETLAKLEEAGVSVSLSKKAAAAAEDLQEGKNVAPVDINKLRQELAGATSDVMKQLTRVSFRHYKTFGEEPDLDAIEKLVGEKGYSVEDAYNVWSEPKRNELREKEIQEKITLGIKEGIQSELSKQGISRTRKRMDDVEPAPLDKPAPSDRELRDAFIKDLDSGVTH